MLKYIIINNVISDYFINNYMFYSFYENSKKYQKKSMILKRQI